MSLILDALRKIEQERRYAGEHGEAPAARGIALESSRRRRAISLLAVMVVIAVISALLTAGAFRFLRDGGETPPEIAAEASAPVASVEAPLDPPAVETRLAKAEPEPSAPRRAPEPAPPPPSYAPSSPAPLPPATDAVDEEPSAAFRLVGQGSPSRTAPISDSTPREAERDPDLPRLVLQGTSVIDGKPVAVISDQRVFEGDHIEGAVVIRIQERAVELEFEGRRFTLTL